MGSRAVAAATRGSDAGSLDFVPVPGRETVVGSCAVAAGTYGSDAGSKSLPVPGRETVVGSCAVAAATPGSDTGSKSLISYRSPVAKLSWVLAL